MYKLSQNLYIHKEAIHIYLTIIIITCITVGSYISRRAVTRVAIVSIHTSTSILTWCTQTFVDNCQRQIDIIALIRYWAQFDYLYEWNGCLNHCVVNKIISFTLVTVSCSPSRVTVTRVRHVLVCTRSTVLTWVWYAVIYA